MPPASRSVYNRPIGFDDAHMFQWNECGDCDKLVGHRLVLRPNDARMGSMACTVEQRTGDREFLVRFGRGSTATVNLDKRLVTWNIRGKDVADDVAACGLLSPDESRARVHIRRHPNKQEAVQRSRTHDQVPLLTMTVRAPSSRPPPSRPPSSRPKRAANAAPSGTATQNKRRRKCANCNNPPRAGYPRCLDCWKRRMGYLPSTGRR
jgi:hypothetical protein